MLIISIRFAILKIYIKNTQFIKAIVIGFIIGGDKKSICQISSSDKCGEGDRHWELSITYGIVILTKECEFLYFDVVTSDEYSIVK